MYSFLDDEKADKGAAIVLWLALWLTTLIHAGSTVGVIISTAKFPPGYEITPNWVSLLGQGPNSGSFWFYIIVLLFNVVFESSLKGHSTFVKSSYPFPDIQVSHVAAGLWLVLWLFGHLGSSNGWFAYPNKLGATFGTCLFFVFLQYFGTKNSFEEDGKLKDKAIPTKTEAVQPRTQITSSQPGLVVAQSKELVTAQVSTNTAPNQVGSSDSGISEKLLDYVRQNGQAKTGGLVEVLGSSKRTVIRNLNKLLADGKIIREGSGPGAVYRLNENPKEGKWN